MKHYNNRHEEKSHFSEHVDDTDLDPVDCQRKMEIKRKLDEKMEKRRLKKELEDFEGELDDDFDWDDLDRK